MSDLEDFDPGKITYDEGKRLKVLEERGLDFADAKSVFAGSVLEFEDDRFEYGETRYLTYGTLADRSVVIVWTRRGIDRRIISMRHVHDRELKARKRTLD